MDAATRTLQNLTKPNKEKNNEEKDKNEKVLSDNNWKEVL